jgi:hypothetical protein
VSALKSFITECSRAGRPFTLSSLNDSPEDGLLSDALWVFPSWNERPNFISRRNCRQSHIYMPSFIVITPSFATSMG